MATVFLRDTRRNVSTTCRLLQHESRHRAEKFFARERLADPAVGIGRFEEFAHALFAHRGNENDRHLMSRSNQRAEAVAGDLGKLDVDEHEIGCDIRQNAGELRD